MWWIGIGLWATQDSIPFQIQLRVSRSTARTSRLWLLSSNFFRSWIAKWYKKTTNDSIKHQQSALIRSRRTTSDNSRDTKSSDGPATTSPKWKVRNIWKMRWVLSRLRILLRLSPTINFHTTIDLLLNGILKRCCRYRIRLIRRWRVCHS